MTEEMFDPFTEQCAVCGFQRGRHSKSCSASNQPCQECGFIKGEHHAECSARPKPLPPEHDPCLVCGGRGGSHMRPCAYFKVGETLVSCDLCGEPIVGLNAGWCRKCQEEYNKAQGMPEQAMAVPYPNAERMGGGGANTASPFVGAAMTPTVVNNPGNARR